MKPVILATDGSISASEATLEAIDLARAFDVPLVAVSVEHVTLPSYGYYGYGEIVTELTRIESEHVDQTLERVRTAAAEAGVECETVHGTRPVVDQICSAARKRDARLIVIGAHGWGPVRRALHGSVSTAVLHQAPCPVLVVPGVHEPFAEDGQAVMLEPGLHV
jgi:nucleotide-binding universal stress UspA family protein